MADIELVYESGPRYTLGKVMFSGDAPFDDDLLKRMVPFKENTPYDSQLIAELTQAMQGSGYFEVSGSMRRPLRRKIRSFR